MSADEKKVKTLKARIAQFKGQITRAEKFATEQYGQVLLDLEGVTIRLEELQRGLHPYKTYVLEIQLSSGGSDESDEDNFADDSVEDRCFAVMAKLRKLINAAGQRADGPGQSLAEPVYGATPAGAAQRCRLPQLDIPFYDGKDITLYTPFIEIFEAIVDKDTNLSPVQKLYYLRKYLQGDALTLVSGLPLQNESYNKALELLGKRYDNKTLLIGHHVNALLDYQPISKGSASEFRHLVSIVRQHLGALSSLGQQVEHWDMLVISILLRKLDSYSCRSYYAERDQTKLPELEELLQFIERRAMGFEESQANTEHVKVEADSVKKELQCIEVEVEFENPERTSGAVQGEATSEPEHPPPVGVDQACARANTGARGERGHCCAVCGDKFTAASSLKRHERVHTGGDKPFSCGTCNKKFGTSDNLKVHERTHLSEKLHSCGVCDKKFATSNHLKVHERIHTDDRQFSCGTCDKKFTMSSHLKKHERIHSGEKPYSCKTCNKKFRELFDLKTHERTHTGEKPYACRICKSTFTQSGSLKAHERTHTGVRPYSCDICRQTFTQSTTLKIHERIHTGERPYPCEICKKTFTGPSALKSHERTHTEERPYPCGICKKTFRRANDLKTHERTHTGERPYSCEVCKRTFKRSNALKAHARIHTGD